ncbi:DUF6918 family protein [Algiphilus sp.]|uniref:DUF6918 family protein n=1 Tax=Algiphilus sp. TaxID=1872431 RepID=UPI003B515816
MTPFRECIEQSPRHDQVIRDCAVLIESFLTNAGGVRGFALRSAVQTAQRKRPDLLETASRRVLPECLDALDPIYQIWDVDTHEDFAVHLVDIHGNRAQQAIIAVIDRRAQASNHRMVQSIYGRMRDSAHRDVERVLPDFGRLLADELALQTQRA